MYKPNFVITNSILNLISRIEVAKAIIENAPIVPAYEARFKREAIIRTVRHGTHLEGNQLETKEVIDLLDGKQVVGRERDIQEIINYRNVLEYIDNKKSESNTQIEILESDLLALHKITVERILPISQAGHYRKNEVVVKDALTGEVSFKPPSFKEVPTLIHDFLTWLNSPDSTQIHPVFVAAITHYVLSYIHPFVDGNGRVARALATMVLFIRNYDIKKFFSLEEYFDKDARRYYKALQDISNQEVSSLSERDLTSWIEYFCQGLAEELERIKEKVRKLSLDTRLKGQIGQILLSERQMKLVEYIEANGSISSREWRNILPDYSDDTILRDLKDLRSKGLIKKKGTTKGAVYVFRK